jgi:phosphoesterase RecJ-like protein
MQMLESIDTSIRRRLEDAQSVAIVSHIRADGDAVGSLLGLGIALMKSGKSVQMALQDGLPEKYRELACSDMVKRTLEPGFDTLIVVDSSDINRTGSLLSMHSHADICIDHHKTNLRFATLNLIEESAVATAAILAEHFPQWGLDIDQEVASCLLTGIIADTIGFRTSNINAEAMRLSAELMDKGANLSKLYGQVLISRSYEEMRYWGAGLDKLTRDAALVWTTLSLNDRIQAGYFENDDADLINVLSAIAEAKIAMIFVEQEGGSVKVSWRANSGIDVSELAFAFGGGGHAAAAGADIQGDLTTVKESVIKATKALLDGRFSEITKEMHIQKG